MGRSRGLAVAASALALAACSGGSGAAAPPRPAPTTTITTTAPTPTPTTAPATTTTTAPPVAVTLAFGGDLLTHLPLVATAQRYGAASGVPYDFGPMLAPLAPVVGGADLALCHLEVPLVGDGQEVTGYPSFHAPRELATAIAGAGYDGCSTASNHSLDGGLPAIEATLRTFDEQGLGHVGTARSAEEALRPRLYDVGGARIAHLSYAYGFNGYTLPDGAPWAANLLDLGRVAAEARAAREAGAQLVVVSVHWGTEYRPDPDPFQEDTARALAGIDDVDLVVGHHAHVVQPVEQVDGTWVVYGLGNQLSNQAEDPRRDGLTILVDVGGPAGGRLGVQGIVAVPTWVDLATHQVLPVVRTLQRGDLAPERRAELEASLARTAEVVGRRGATLELA